MRVRELLSGLLICAAVSAALPLPAAGQVSRLTIVAPAAPGGGWDQTARTMQQVLQQTGITGPAKVVNIPGAGGTVGLAQFVNTERGKGDVLMAMGLIMVGAVITNKSPVTLDQVTPIARLTGEFEVLVVPAASPYKTLGDLLKALKADPGKVAIAGGSAGGTDHMLAGLLAKAAGADVTKLNYIPHSGGGESIASLVGNQVAAGINGLGELESFIKAGRLRALGISSDKRLPGTDIPTFVEQGVTLTLANWRGVVAPPGLTAAQKATLVGLLDKLHASAAWKDVLAKNNWTDMYQTGAGFDTFLKDEHTRASGILKSIGLVK